MPNIEQAHGSHIEDDFPSLRRRFVQDLEAQLAISDSSYDFSSFDQWKGDRVFEMLDEVDVDGRKMEVNGGFYNEDE